MQQTSVLGASLLYARMDHTHQSPTIYWPQGVGPNDNVVSNRDNFLTVTTATQGATNLASYNVGYIGNGAAGDFSTIGGGFEHEASGSYDTIAGGFQNGIGPTATPDPANAILGGSLNSILSFNLSAISGGIANTINNALDGAYEGSSAYIGGGFGNQVYLSGGVAHGISARAYMAGQMAFSSGGIRFGAIERSESQYSHIVLANKTLGGLANESVQLVQWVEAGNTPSLQPNRCYTALLEVVATRVGTTDQHNWTIGVSARTDGAGAVTIKHQSTIYEYTDANAALYTITVTASGSDIVVTFATGAGNIHQVNVSCTMRLSEVITTAV